MKNSIRIRLFYFLLPAFSGLILWNLIAEQSLEDEQTVRAWLMRTFICLLVSALVVPFLRLFRPLQGYWQSLVLAVFLLLVFIQGIQVTRFSLYELLDRDGFLGAERLLLGMTSPKLEILPKAISNMTVTLFMSFIATLMAVPFAFFLSFFVAKNVVHGTRLQWFRWWLRGGMNLVSSVEVLIWAIVFSIWVGIGPFAGVLALMLHSIMALARGFSELIEVAEIGPIEGIRATGANMVQVIWFGILPQVFLPFVSLSIYRWDINIRMATVVGLVGGGGIGTLIIQKLGQGLWNELGAVILVVAVSVWILDYFSSSLREVLK